MRPPSGRRQRGMLSRALHHGREFGRHDDACVRKSGPALKIGAQSLAPALLGAGLPQAAAVTAVAGQAADSYSQLRSQMG